MLGRHAYMLPALQLPFQDLTGFALSTYLLLVGAMTAYIFRHLLFPKTMGATPPLEGSISKRQQGKHPRMAPYASAQHSARTSDSKAAMAYVPFSSEAAGSVDVMVVDCTHPAALTFTHHKGHRNPPLDMVPGSDTSTGLVLNALRASQELDSPAMLSWMDKPKVSVNHFDADALLSLWSYVQRDDALRHEGVLRHTARLGDFREGGFGDGQHAQQCLGWDGLSSEGQALRALKVACWINTVERTRFSAPYEGKDADEKFGFFLGALLPVLEDPEGVRGQWEEEYREVLQGWRLLEEGRSGGSVVRYDDIGLAVLRPPRPLHYYSLFSHAIGCDVVLCQYPGQRYEVECRYTQFVNVYSRPVHARLDLEPLAVFLNEVDGRREAGTRWAVPRFVDTGPLLRLDKDGEKLSKKERYGHPTERPIFVSGIPQRTFQQLVASYIQHGLKGCSPKVGGWGWDELHQVNDSIDWDAWRDVAAERLADQEQLG